MKRKKLFTEKEWQRLAESPFVVGMAVSDADLTGTSAISEFHETLNTLSDAELKYANNPLIAEIIQDAELERVFNDEEEPETEDIAKFIRKVLKTLNGKVSSKEILEYKEFLYETGVRVAEAYNENTLNIGSNISDKEKLILDKIKKVLDL